MSIRHPEILTRPEDKWPTRICLGIVICVAVLFASSPAWSAQRSQGAVYLPHPSGCPRVAFCGCGASADLFGRPVRALYLAAAWFKFPKAVPARNMAGVKSHHVMVLKEHVRGNIWLVADYNSGGHKSRLHQRSIAGFRIVDPRSRMAGA